MTTRVDSAFTAGVVKQTTVASKTATKSASNDGKIVQLDTGGLISSALIPPSTGLEITERNSDPGNPAEGSAVIWMSDGTGTGDDGDILIKITAGGATKTATLVDFSGV